MVFLNDNMGNKFCVQNIYGIGRNYAEHARELGNPVLQEPIVFMKSTATLGPQSGEINFGDVPEEPHHEVELVLWIKKGGQKIKSSEAKEHIGAIAVGIDFTLRDVQAQCKAQGHPWTWGKCFPASAVCSSLLAFSDDLDLKNLQLKLWLDDQLKQNDSTASMIMDCEKIIELLSHKVPLLEGDLVFTGTPSGVGPVASGQRIRVQLSDRLESSWRIANC